MLKYVNDEFKGEMGIAIMVLLFFVFASLVVGFLITLIDIQPSCDRFLGTPKYDLCFEQLTNRIN